MREYIVNFKFFQLVIKAENAKDAFIKAVLPKVNPSDIFWTRDDLRKYLLKFGFKTLQNTNEKTVFLLNK